MFWNRGERHALVFFLSLDRYKQFTNSLVLFFSNNSVPEKHVKFWRNMCFLDERFYSDGCKMLILTQTYILIVKSHNYNELIWSSAQVLSEHLFLLEQIPWKQTNKHTPTHPLHQNKTKWKQTKKHHPLQQNRNNKRIFNILCLR